MQIGYKLWSESMGAVLKTVRQQIYLLEIKPKTKEAVYDDEVLEILRAIPPQGRPKKEK